MKIDPNIPICGLRPAKLKHLLRLTNITVIGAAKRLCVTKPEALFVLTSLEGAGWLELASGRWWPTDLAARLSATPLTKPIPVEEALIIVERLIAEARAINRDPSHSFQVASLMLFGSLLTAASEETVGDIDAAAQLVMREDDPDSRAILWTAEVITAPSSHRGVRIQMWPHDRLVRRLRQIDRRISLHDAFEASAFDHRVIYAFDRDTGTETLTPLSSD